MAKRSSYQPAKRRDRKTSRRDYAAILVRNGGAYHYPFPTGKAAMKDRERHAGKSH